MKSTKAILLILVMLQLLLTSAFVSGRETSDDSTTKVTTKSKKSERPATFDYTRLWISAKYGWSYNNYYSQFPQEVMVQSDWGSIYGASVEMNAISKLYLSLGIYRRTVSMEFFKAFSFSGDGTENLTMKYLNVQLLGKLRFIDYMWIGLGPSAFFYLGKDKRIIKVSDRLSQHSTNPVDLQDKEKSFLFGADFGLGFIIPIGGDFSLGLDAIYTYDASSMFDLGDDKKHNFSSWGLYTGITYLFDLKMFSKK